MLKKNTAALQSQSFKDYATSKIFTNIVKTRTQESGD